MAPKGKKQAAAKAAAAKKDDTSKDPTAAKEIRALLTKQGAVIDSSGIKSLDHAVRTRGFSALMSHGKNDPVWASDLAAAKTHEQKRALLAKFCLAAGDGTLAAKNTTSVSVKTKKLGEWLWLTEAQIASPTYLNDPTTTALVIKDLDSQPSRFPSAAAAGVLEYHYWFEYKVSDETHEKKSEVERTCDISEQDYSVATMAMDTVADNIMGVTPTPTAIHVSSGIEPLALGDGEVEEAPKKKKRGGTTLVTKNLTPDEQEVKELEDSYEAAKTALLGVHGKIKKELMDVCLIEERLRLKAGWGEAACTTIREGAEAQRKIADELYARYVEACLLGDDASYADEKEKFEALKKLMVTETEKATASYDIFVSVTIGDFCKLKKMPNK